LSNFSLKSKWQTSSLELEVGPVRAAKIRREKLNSCPYPLPSAKVRGHLRKQG